jgi:hypothetical protein
MRNAIRHGRMFTLNPQAKLLGQDAARLWEAAKEAAFQEARRTQL